jgi:hypothetical protein
VKHIQLPLGWRGTTLSDLELHRFSEQLIPILGASQVDDVCTLQFGQNFMLSSPSRFLRVVARDSITSTNKALNYFVESTARRKGSEIYIDCNG